MGLTVFSLGDIKKILRVAMLGGWEAWKPGSRDVEKLGS
jgi:hypothetical protein